MKYTFDRTVRLIIGAIILIVIVLLINRLSSVLLPFLIGWLIAYLIHPIVCFVQNKMKVKNRAAAIALTLTAIIAATTGLVWLLIPAISNEVNKSMMLLNDFMSSKNNATWSSTASTWIGNIMEQFKNDGVLNAANLKGILEKMLPGVWNVISGTWQVIAGLFVVFVVFLYVIFILLDYEKINSGFRGMIPLKYKDLVLEIIDDVERGMNRYFRGQALVALLVGIMFAIGFKIVGLPMGITVGLFIGVLNLVPYLQTIGIVPVTLLALVQSAETGTNFWWIIGGCALVFVVVQGTQDLVIVPKIMGKAMGLNPAVILLSLSIWGSLLGIAGMIIALPITTLLISYYKRFVLKNNNLPTTTAETKNEQQP